MPISLYRGEVIFWNEGDLKKFVVEGETSTMYMRKEVEREIKRIQKEINNLPPASTFKNDVLVVGDWVCWLSPHSRKERGRAQGHCLGDAVGFEGDPYIAVSNGQWDYGFQIHEDYLEFDQVYGPGNSPCLKPRAEEALEIARTVLPKNQIGNDQGDRYMLQVRLERFRTLEFILGRLSGRIEPRVEFDKVTTHQYEFRIQVWSNWSAPSDMVELYHWAQEEGLNIHRAKGTIKITTLAYRESDLPDPPRGFHWFRE